MTVILPDPGAQFVWVPAPWEPTSPSEAVLQCRPLADIAPHFFTTRILQLRGDSPRADADWTRVAAGIGVPVSRLQRMHQVHGCATSAVRLPGASAAPGAAASTTHPAASSIIAAGPEADALVTDLRDVALVVRVADCVPLLMADSRTGAVAAVHAGWRGTSAGIASVAVRRLQQEYGANPPDLVAAIGPAIGACCYQVGPEVRDAFLAAGHAPASVDTWFAADPDDAERLRLDAWASNRDQLIAAGLRPDHVHVAELCTMTHLAHFYSYRAEGTSTGRLLGVIRRSA
jgi:polyphenol oxidase